LGHQHTLLGLFIFPSKVNYVPARRNTRNRSRTPFGTDFWIQLQYWLIASQPGGKSSCMALTSNGHSLKSFVLMQGEAMHAPLWMADRHRDIFGLASIWVPLLPNFTSVQTHSHTLILSTTDPVIHIFYSLCQVTMFHKHTIISCTPKVVSACSLAHIAVVVTQQSC
jgi:hypothetical protein